MSTPGELDPAAGLSIDEIVAQLDARIEVLKPLVREFDQLEAARAALVADYSAAPARARRSPRPAAAAPARGRRAPRGANRAAILRVVGERPGISVAEIAEATAIGKPTVHSTVYALTRRGELERAGDGVKLAGAAAPAASSAPSATPAKRPAARRPARRAARAARSRPARRRAGSRAPARRTSASAAAAPSSPEGDDAPGPPAASGKASAAE